MHGGAAADGHAGPLAGSRRPRCPMSGCGCSCRRLSGGSPKRSETRSGSSPSLPVGLLAPTSALPSSPCFFSIMLGLADAPASMFAPVIGLGIGRGAEKQSGQAQSDLVHDHLRRKGKLFKQRGAKYRVPANPTPCFTGTVYHLERNRNRRPPKELSMNYDDIVPAAARSRSWPFPSGVKLDVLAPGNFP